MKNSEKIGTLLMLSAICIMYVVSKPLFIIYIIGSVFNYANDSIYTNLDVFTICKKSYAIFKELLDEIKREID